MLKSILNLKAVFFLFLAVFAVTGNRQDPEEMAREWLKANGKTLETKTIAAGDSSWTEGVIT